VCYQAQPQQLRRRIEKQLFALKRMAMYHFHCKPIVSGCASIAPHRPVRQLKTNNYRGRRSRLRLKIIPVGLCAAALTLAVAAGGKAPSSIPQKSSPPVAVKPSEAQPSSRPLSKPEVQRLLGGSQLLNIAESRLTLPQSSGCLTIQTTIDPGLQQFLVQHLDLKNSRYIGIVIMDPTDGRVLAMAGHDKADPQGNPCLESRFPAASIFKIITAAAAVETGALDPDSVLNFDGGKHTLYKSQISQRPSKNANRISLKDSFAQSINPVFGRLGVHMLGRDVIESYAEAFGFNREIDFELPIRPSQIQLSDEAYELAEVASGFNRTTRISPLHGALMAAAILNRGRLVEPTIIDWIADENGRTLYQSRLESGDRIIDPQTAGVLREMMQATVLSGTARKEFQKHHDDRILSRLEIGGKTGSMGDGDTATRYDWFVGYADDHKGAGRVVFSVVVAHEDFIGTRAAAYAAMALKEYFRIQLARLEPPHATTPRS
jgi:cell division protein FtsI/penicillin-binding protein 2